MRTYPSTNPIVHPLGKAHLDFVLTEPSMHPGADRPQSRIEGFTLTTRVLQPFGIPFDNSFLPHHPGFATLISTFRTLHVNSIKRGGRLEPHPNTRLDQVTSNSTGIPEDGVDAGDDDVETEEDDDDDLGEEDEFDEEEDIGEKDSIIRDDDGDEDEFGEADEDEKLTGDRNGTEEEDDLESIEEIEEEEDEDDSDLNAQEPEEEVDDEDYDEDDDEYGSDWDEDDDEDELDDDDDELKGLNFSPRPNSLPFSPTPLLGSKPTPLSRANPNHTGQGPESIDYDIT